MSPAQIQKECDDGMKKAVQYLRDELAGVRTGRAAPGLVEHLKINVASYGSTMDLRELASISAPEAALLVVKPYDPGVIKDIEKSILASNVGLTPMIDGGTIRLPVPPLSGERRQQLIQEIRKMAEMQKVAVRNARRDANKHIDAEKKDHKISEDEADSAKDEVQKLTKRYEQQIDELTTTKQQEIEQV